MDKVLSTLQTATHRPSIARKLVFREFRKMKRGRLRMTCPDGTEVNFGDSDEITATIAVKSEKFFSKCVWYGDIGFGEAYVDGDWETDSITRVVHWFILNIESGPSMSGSKNRFSATNFLRGFNRLYHLTRDNSVKTGRQNIEAHYDLSNDFFRTFLDDTMTYSSAYFKNEQLSLEQAQIRKYEKLCRSINLTSNDHVLEIGTGWGGFAVYAASTYRCKIKTITISSQQFEYAKERIRNEHLEDLVSVEKVDYRHIQGKFDKLVSIEMLEAVGHRYLKTFFCKCHDVLGPQGVMGLQVIVCPDSRYDSLRRGVDWIQKHIFPGSLLPSVGALNKAINATGDLTMYDASNFGHDYSKTLRLWRERFNLNRDVVTSLGFTDSFIRKWNYYLSYCEAAFASRNINVMQLVYARPNTTHL